MARTRKSRSSVKRKTTKRKPIGFTKEGKSYKLVFGTKAKPRAGIKKYRTKAALTKAAQRYL